tara:strand:- start:977 stop:1201 length:225 start_codon:yes stop_codon:yes gene_type:complete
MVVSQPLEKAVNFTKKLRELLLKPKKLSKKFKQLQKKLVDSLGSSKRKSPSPQQLQLRPKQKRQRLRFGMRVEL